MVFWCLEYQVTGTPFMKNIITVIEHLVIRQAICEAYSKRLTCTIFLLGSGIMGDVPLLLHLYLGKRVSSYVIPNQSYSNPSSNGQTLPWAYYVSCNKQILSARHVNTLFLV